MDNRIIPKVRNILILLLVFSAALTAVAEDRLLIGKKDRLEPVPGDNRVQRRCLTPRTVGKGVLPLEREKPWSLPKAALAADFGDTINVLVLRYNFQYETTDDPNTTGRGHMNLARLETVQDTLDYLDSMGHFIDPPPHDSAYFDAHMRALRLYWETVSDGKITLNWDVYPPRADSVYELSHPMSHYGRCDFSQVIAGLELYFIDCIQLADTVSPEIDFGRYESIVLFHAGSDGQNDIGFPPTCSDLFTGFIVFGDSLAVDNDSNYVRTALLMPETTSQDSRATALNGVMAHEFGHQLGLVDLYSTFNFMSVLGDFALMDNNGFGSGIDFGFRSGSVFGAIPVYPIAWSRAFLGFVEVVDFRQGSDIRLVAAEMISEGIKVARIPITEYEYYLIENRSVDLDGEMPAARADSATSVILGPANLDAVFNREYDFLLPGSGMLIFHVDERVAALDYDYNGYSNFVDNQLQWPFDIFGNRVDRFIRLVEADGIVNFGDIYRAGFGGEDDMFRDDRNDAFTPNTNPPAIDNSGNNTHIFITGITRATDPDGSVLADSVMYFDVETDKLVEGFPVRAGRPVWGLSPITDDLDGDGNPEIIYVSSDFLCVSTPDGQNFLRQYTQCDDCPVLQDTVNTSVTTGTAYPVHLYARPPGIIRAGPVTGAFADNPGQKLVAVGYETEGSSTGRVDIYRLTDEDADGQADLAGGEELGSFSVAGTPLILSFGDLLYCVTDSGRVFVKDQLSEDPVSHIVIEEDQLHGSCRLDDRLLVLAGDNQSSILYYIEPDLLHLRLDLGRIFTLGPVLVDVDLDEIPEVVVGSYDGRVALVTVDTLRPGDPFVQVIQKGYDFSFAVNPVVSDVDLDGYPDVVFGGINAVYAFNRELTLKTDFPIEVNDRFPSDTLVAPPVIADIEHSGPSEIIFPTVIGNIYSFGPNLSSGFPLSAGEFASGSPVYLSDTVGGKLGYLGEDGWFYLWHVDDDRSRDFWPMHGADPAGTFAFEADKLPAEKQYATAFPERSFYNYPNPVVDGLTTIRYFLAEEAVSVELTIYDLSGKKVEQLDGPTSGRVDNELVWECGSVPPGVYRCVIDVMFGDFSETAFTDIAIIR